MTFLKSCIVAVLLAGVLPHLCGALDEPERTQFADGLYARGMYDLAAREYEALLRDFPESAKADVMHFRLAECYRELDDRVRAEKEYRLVFSDYPASAFRLRAGFRRAGIFLDAGLFDSAVDLYEKVLVSKPPAELESASLYFLGLALLKLDRAKDAQDVLERLTAKHAGAEFWSYGQLKLGEMHETAGRHSEALACFGKAVGNPGSARVGAEALFQIAQIHFGLKDFKKSAEAYGKLLADYPDDQRTGQARLQAAWAAHNAGLYVEALKSAVEVLAARSGSEDAEWLYLKGNCERQLMKNKEAVRAYDDLLKRFPESAFANASLYEKALVLYKTGDHAAAVAAARAVHLTPELRKDVYWLLAESYAALDKGEEAIQYYRLLTREFPDSDLADDANYRLGHYLRTQGRNIEAARSYRLVADGFPDSPLAAQALFASAACFAKEGEYEEALRDWTTLVRTHPSDALVEETLYQKAMGETHLERDDEAIGTLQKLMTRFPKTRFAADAHYWRGLLLRKTGKVEDAEKELRQALKAGPREELEREIKYRLAVVLQERGGHEESADLVAQLLKTPFRTSLPPELLRWLAEFRLGQKRYAEASSIVTVLLDQNRGAAWQEAGWCLSGRALLAAGDSANAAEAFRKSLGAKASTVFAAESALRLGEIEMQAGNSETASSYFKRAAFMSGDDAALAIRAHAYAGLARVAKSLADDENAARYFMSVAILYDEEDLVPECLFEAAGAFGRLGKNEEMSRTVAELKERFPKSEWTKKAGDLLPGTAPAAGEPVTTTGAPS